MNKKDRFLARLVLEAGSLIRSYFGKIGVAHAKMKTNVPVNLVSRADIQAQNLVVRKIRKNFPGEAILAEEGDLSGGGESLKHGPLWVLDPLDGTVNFLHGFPLFAVSLAFCQNGVPQAGAIYDPVHEELFWAKKGGGAYLFRVEGLGYRVRLLDKKKLRVSQTQKLVDSLMITGFGYDRQEKADFYLRFWKAFLTRAHDVRRIGAAAIDLAWVAAGRADGFWEWGLKAWDVAAGLLLIHEAGGKVTHFDGSSYSIFESQETLATNGRIHTDCLAVVRRVVL